MREEEVKQCLFACDMRNNKHLFYISEQNNTQIRLRVRWLEVGEHGGVRKIFFKAIDLM
jgi:hypothetical protein